ncbi:MAG: uroporphyrinogen decarboxylase, partial [Candidatus Margulisbacteria bacterium]|nr:uroporphyrinogen decarboxylase [Candidatus Margulisiibacteriota bacterium]
MTESLYLNAAACQDVSRPPIWIMRQAGRYLPEYRQIRQSRSFMDMIKTPEIATEITLQPITRFGMDAAILFSDILGIVETFGYTLTFEEGKGPILSPKFDPNAPVNGPSKDQVYDTMQYVPKAISLIKQALPSHTPLIGFAGAPFTVASYIIEGSSTKTFSGCHHIMKTAPDTFHDLLNALSTATIHYLNSQMEAGVDAIQIFDSWINCLSPNQFETFSLPYLKKVVSGISNPKNLPVTVFGKGIGNHIQKIEKIGASVIGLDSSCDLPLIRKQVSPKIALQGNMDPHLLYESDDKIVSHVNNLLSKMRPWNGYIFNL